MPPRLRYRYSINSIIRAIKIVLNRRSYESSKMCSAKISNDVNSTTSEC